MPTRRAARMGCDPAILAAPCGRWWPLTSWCCTQAKGADKFSPPGNGTAAANKYETAMVAPVDVGYEPCFEGQDMCKKWCAKNPKSWLNKCTWSKYCAG